MPGKGSEPYGALLDQLNSQAHQVQPKFVHKMMNDYDLII